MEEKNDIKRREEKCEKGESECGRKWSNEGEERKG